jgi:hypothetical protein
MTTLEAVKFPKRDLSRSASSKALSAFHVMEVMHSDEAVVIGEAKDGGLQTLTVLILAPSREL